MRINKGVYNWDFERRQLELAKQKCHLGGEAAAAALAGNCERLAAVPFAEGAPVICSYL